MQFFPSSLLPTRLLHILVLCIFLPLSISSSPPPSVSLSRKEAWSYPILPQEVLRCEAALGLCTSRRSTASVICCVTAWAGTARRPAPETGRNICLFKRALKTHRHLLPQLLVLSSIFFFRGDERLLVRCTQKQPTGGKKVAAALENRRILLLDH